MPKLSRSTTLLCLSIALTLCFLGSLAIGLAYLPLSTVVEAFTAFDGSREHLIMRDVRLPRALTAAMVGAGLGVAGALMQALTRNPLASPGILGINSGAALMVVISVFAFRVGSLAGYAAFSFLGAAISALAVYAMGSLGKGGMTPLKLTVAGAALTAFLASLTQAILILNQRTLDEMRFWLAGSVAGREMQLVIQVLPFMLIGLIAALVMARQITTLSLGEDVAKGLGQRTGLTKAVAAIAVVMLAGSAVAVAGPVGFIGLAVPHIARGLVGPDYRWVLPASAFTGGILLLLADIGARLVIKPNEVPVGVMTAVLGVPFFIYLARRGVRRA